MRWNHDKSHKHNAENKHNNNGTYKAIDDTKQDDKGEDPTTPLIKGSGYYQRSVDDSYFIRSKSSALSRTASRRSHTPTPSLGRSSSRSSNVMSTLKRSMSKKRTNSNPSQFETPHMTLTKMMSQKNMNMNNINNNISTPRKNNSSESLSRSTSSHRSTTPIIFSQSTAKRKPQPIERKLECSLEELCFGAIKKVMIFRDVISDAGIIVQEEEILQINVKPGWKKGTKVTFEGKGDEKPGYLATDIVFLIEEKQHPAYKRIGNDLELGVEVPLVKALVGFSISLPLLGGEKMMLKIDEVIHPGYEKIIPNQGMRISMDNEQRGDLRLKFLIVFPTHLSEDQRSKICHILQGCFY